VRFVERKPTRVLSALGIVAAVVVAAVVATELADADNDGVVSTVQPEMGGGFSPVTISPGDLPLASDVAVRGEVLDVLPAHLTTDDGDWPPVDPAAGPGQRFGINIVTPVRVRITEVLGERPIMSDAGTALFSDVEVGDVVEITVAGGSYSYILQPDEARALGVLVVDGEGTEYFPEPDDPSTAERSELGESEEEVESFPTEPIEMTDSVAPGVELAEGYDVLLFLSAHTDSGLGNVVHIVGAGQGAFAIASNEGRATVPGTDNMVLPLAQLERIAREVNDAQGSPIDVTEEP